MPCIECSNVDSKSEEFELGIIHVERVVFGKLLHVYVRVVFYLPLYFLH